jgi:hypothetical protein
MGWKLCGNILSKLQGKHGLIFFLRVSLFRLCGLLINSENMRVSEARVLKRIFGPKKDDVTEEWKFHNEELHNL